MNGYACIYEAYTHMDDANVGRHFERTSTGLCFVALLPLLFRVHVCALGEIILVGLEGLGIAVGEFCSDGAVFNKFCIVFVDF